ncbi:MAG: hypothetical protein HWN81_11980 [Candidatus Lokiarchaeota archaeon]|nr:hypothetical protein [Candidatus Lokiarchaeota archaeon]
MTKSVNTKALNVVLNQALYHDMRKVLNVLEKDNSPEMLEVKDNSSFARRAIAELIQRLKKEYKIK